MTTKPKNPHPDVVDETGTPLMTCLLYMKSLILGEMGLFPTRWEIPNHAVDCKVLFHLRPHRSNLIEGLPQDAYINGLIHGIRFYMKHTTVELYLCDLMRRLDPNGTHTRYPIVSDSVGYVHSIRIGVGTAESLVYLDCIDSPAHMLNLLEYIGVLRGAVLAGYDPLVGCRAL